jgi:hypothetical protein
LTAGIAGFATPAHAATTPGTCDFGAPSVGGFVCIDSDDPSVRVGPAHTDNGIVADDLDVDWYDQIGGTTRRVSVRGSLFIDAGAVGKATLRVRCLRSNDSVLETKTVQLTSNSSFHTGLDKAANLSCSATNLAKVSIKVTFEDFGGSRSDSKNVAYKGN